jgi:Ca2+-binding RTX toxin-like protein
VIIAHRTIPLVLLASMVMGGVPAHAGHDATCHGIPATIVGTSGRDSVGGTPNDDVATMRGSGDRFDGFHGDDLICGDDGNDVLVPGRGNDTVYPGAGRDLVTEGPRSGSDRVYGGVGGDTLRASGGSDVIRAGAGPDLLVAGSGRDELYGWTGDDVLKANRDNGSEDYLEGGPGHDTCHVRVEDTTVRCEASSSY